MTIDTLPGPARSLLYVAAGALWTLLVTVALLALTEHLAVVWYAHRYARHPITSQPGATAFWNAPPWSEDPVLVS